MTAEAIARYVVAKAVWAPSVHNTQPWRFTFNGSRSACTPMPTAAWSWLTRMVAR